jgi:hypothetical protein
VPEIQFLSHLSIGKKNIISSEYAEFMYDKELFPDCSIKWMILHLCLSDILQTTTPHLLNFNATTTKKYAFAFLQGN